MVIKSVLKGTGKLVLQPVVFVGRIVVETTARLAVTLLMAYAAHRILRDQVDARLFSSPRRRRRPLRRAPRNARI